jgi:hypothetical protein
MKSSKLDKGDGRRRELYERAWKNLKSSLTLKKSKRY